MNKYFSKRLIEVRNAYKLSGYAFAKKLNIPQPTYLRYEAGDLKPSGKLIESLLTVLNVNIYWLFTGRGAMFFDPEQNSGARRFDEKIEQRVAAFGKRLSELQAKHNFLDREMAILLNISERAYVSIISGSSAPDIAILNKIKQNFNVSIDYLLYGETSAN